MISTTSNNQKRFKDYPLSFWFATLQPLQRQFWQSAATAA